MDAFGTDMDVKKTTTPKSNTKFWENKFLKHRTRQEGV